MRPSSLALLLALSLLSLRQTAAQELSEEDRALLARFEGLGLDSVARGPLVRVQPGEPPRGCCRAGPGPAWRYGFLVDEDAESFTVVHTFWRERYLKQPPPLPMVGAPRYERLDLAVELSRLLREENPQDEWYAAWPHLVRERAVPSRNLGLLLLARAVAARGRAGDAAALIERARRELVSSRVWLRNRWRRRVPQRRTPATRGRRPAPPPSPVNLSELLDRELPPTLLWACVESCGDPDVSCAALVERFRSLIGAFPDSKEAAVARGFVADLEALGTEPEAAEDAARDRPRALGSVLWELGPTTEQLVAQLAGLAPRMRLVHPVPTWHLDDPESPSARLLERGLAAVPALLAVCDDPRPTRIVTHYPARRGDPRAYLLRRGDLALQILQKTAGRAFSDAEAARRWWALVERYGQVGALDRMVREGQADALQLLSRLEALDPQRALDAAMAATVVAPSHLRSRLVSYVANRRGARVRAFLLDEVWRGPDLRGRLVAARTLHERGCTAWAEPLAVELIRKAEAGEGLGTRDVREVLRLLALADRRAGLEVLRRRYPALPAQAKRALLDACGLLVGREPALGERVQPLLVTALEDRSVYRGTWSGAGVIRACNAPLGEGAAMLLAYSMGRAFDAHAPPPLRRRQAAVLANAWRRSRGLPVKPLPSLPQAPPLDRAALTAAEALLARARGPRDLAPALAALRALGVHGLAPLEADLERRRRSGRPGDRACVEPLQALRRALASTVTSVEVHDPHGLLPLEDRALYDALTGLQLGARLAVGLLGREVRRPGTASWLRVHRDGRGRGVSVVLALRPRRGRVDEVRVDVGLREGRRLRRHSLRFARPLGEKELGKLAALGARWTSLVVAEPNREWELDALILPPE